MERDKEQLLRDIDWCVEDANWKSRTDAPIEYVVESLREAITDINEYLRRFGTGADPNGKETDH